MVSMPFARNFQKVYLMKERKRERKERKEERKQLRKKNKHTFVRKQKHYCFFLDGSSQD